MVSKSTNSADSQKKSTETKATEENVTATKAVNKQVAETPAEASEKSEFSYADLLEINAQRGVKTHSKAFALEQARKAEKNHKWG